MKYCLCVISTLSILISIGCKPGLVSPQQRVIAELDRNDYGLQGTWQALPDPIFDTADHGVQVTIELKDEGVYRVKSESMKDIDVSLRATTLGNDSRSAIVEAELKKIGALEISRFLLIAERKKD